MPVQSNVSVGKEIQMRLCNGSGQGLLIVGEDQHTVAELSIPQLRGPLHVNCSSTLYSSGGTSQQEKLSVRSVWVHLEIHTHEESAVRLIVNNNRPIA